MTKNTRTLENGELFSHHDDSATRAIWRLVIKQSTMNGEGLGGEESRDVPVPPGNVQTPKKQKDKQEKGDVHSPARLKTLQIWLPQPTTDEQPCGVNAARFKGRANHRKIDKRRKGPT